MSKTFIYSFIIGIALFIIQMGYASANDLKHDDKTMLLKTNYNYTCEDLTSLFNNKISDIKLLRDKKYNDINIKDDFEPEMSVYLPISGCGMTVSASGGASICPGSSASLNATVSSASGNYTVSASGSGYDQFPGVTVAVPFNCGFTGATISNIEYTISDLSGCGSYYYTYLSENGSGTFATNYCSGTYTFSNLNNTSATTGHQIELWVYDPSSPGEYGEYLDAVSVTLSVKVYWTNPDITYSWSPTTGLSNPNIKNPTASPSSTTTYTVTASTANGCTASSSTTVTVLPVNTCTSPSPSPSYLCVNTALSPNIIISTTSATGISNDGVSGANGLPAGVSAHWASNTITISGTPTVSGIFNYSIPLTGGCGTVNATGKIFVNPASIAPTSVTPVSPTICEGETQTLNVEGGMIAYYPFSANLNDASGSGLNLSGSGGTITGDGLQLTTSSNYLSPATLALNTDYHTISFYIKFTSSYDGNWRKIFGYEPTGSVRSPGIWMFDNSNVGMHWRYQQNGTVCCSDANSNTGVNETGYALDQWYYVVGIKNGNNFKIYVDGTLKQDVTVANPKYIGSAQLHFGGAGVKLKEFKLYNGVFKWYSSSCGSGYVGYGPSIDVSPTSTTTYYVRSEGLCNNTTCASRAVNVTSLPVPNAGTPVSTCNTTPVNVTAGASAANYSSIEWSGGNGGTWANNTSLVNATYTPSAADVTAGSVTLTLKANGNSPCGYVTSTKTLTIISPSVNAGSPVSTCASFGAVIITAGASVSQYANVLWTSSGTGAWANPTSLTLATYTPSPADIAAGSVTLTLTASNPTVPCSGTAISTKTLTIASTLAASITPGGATTFCGGNSLTLTAGGGSTYQWSTGETTSSISVSSTGTYTVSITNTGGCASTPASQAVTVNTKPVGIVSSSSPTICAGFSMELSASGSIAGSGTINSYQWYRNGAIITGATNVTYTTNIPGNYSVVITNNNGCSTVACP